MPRFFSLLIVLLVAASPLQAQRITELDALMHGEIEAGHIPGAVLQIVQGDGVLHQAAYGYAQRYGYGMQPLDPPDTMTTDHLFDLASLTKVLGTTFGVMLLVDRGLIDLDAPVRTYLPEFAGGKKSAVTVRHLLTHTAGLAQWLPLYYHASTKTETYETIARLPLSFDVGKERRYSDLGFMLLGCLVERVTDRPLDRFLHDELFGPLGLERTTFTPLAHGVEAAAIAATSHGNPFERRMVYDDDFGYQVDVDPASWDAWREYTLRGEVNDGNAYHANEGVAGHAGLFSTVDDVRTLLDLLLHKGRHGDEQILSRDVVHTFFRRDHTGNGLGWMMDPAIIPAVGTPDGTFGHTGFTGTYVAVIPELDVTIILLTNRQNVGTQGDGTYHNLNPTRQRVVDVVLELATK
ncbi:MAG: serine hydrolase [Rhodothermales bacterium]